MTYREARFGSSKYICSNIALQINKTPSTNAKGMLTADAQFTLHISLKARDRLGGSRFSVRPNSYGDTMAGLRNLRKTALATAPVPFSGKRCDTTWNRQWHTLFSWGGNLKERRDARYSKVISSSLRHVFKTLEHLFELLYCKCYAWTWNIQKSCIWTPIWDKSVFHFGLMTPYYNVAMSWKLPILFHLMLISKRDIESALSNCIFI